MVLKFSICYVGEVIDGEVVKVIFYIYGLNIFIKDSSLSKNIYFIE